MRSKLCALISDLLVGPNYNSLQGHDMLSIAVAIELYLLAKCTDQVSASPKYFAMLSFEVCSYGSSVSSIGEVSIFCYCLF